MPNPAIRPPSVTLAARLIREPMFHFLLAGAALFGLQALASGPEAGAMQARDRIVVTEGRVRQLAQVFANTWRRPPTPAELDGLVDAFVKEEVYYREAVRLGLDRDDTLVRRRMQQKMEFLIEPGEEALTAGDAQLQRHLEANREAFRIPPRLTFSQIFFREGPNAQARAVALLERLRAGPDSVPGAPGDSTPLPAGMESVSPQRIAGDFGAEFAGSLERLPRGEWAGPVRSAYGFHLVRVTSYEEAADPPLAEVRAAVERDWRQARRKAHIRSEYERLRAKYDVVLDFKQPGALTE